MTDVTVPLATLSYDELTRAVAGQGVAIRSVSELQPAGGSGDKVFPPTYQGGQYHLETRRVGGEQIETVVLDSVQSQANRMELALLAARERGELEFPLLVADFSSELPHIGRITALEAPHRIADAIFRDSLLDGVRFRDSEPGRRFTTATVRDATPLLELCPTALVFGVWDSTGPRGGLGAKFARALVSEIVGFDAVVGHRTRSRIDVLPISSQASIYRAEDEGWTSDPANARRGKKGEPELYVGKSKKGIGKPSAANLGNVMPDLARSDRGEPLPGGVTISHALQTTVLSLAGLRKLRFAIAGQFSVEVDDAARVLLAALGLAALAFQRSAGFDLRSRCLLVPTAPLSLEVLGGSGSEPASYTLDAASAAGLVEQAAARAREVGFNWSGDDIVLMPEPKLVELVRRSEDLLVAMPAEPDEQTE